VLYSISFAHISIIQPGLCPKNGVCQKVGSLPKISTGRSKEYNPRTFQRSPSQQQPIEQIICYFLGRNPVCPKIICIQALFGQSRSAFKNGCWEVRYSLFKSKCTIDDMRCDASSSLYSLKISLRKPNSADYIETVSQHPFLNVLADVLSSQYANQKEEKQVLWMCFVFLLSTAHH